MDTLLSEKVKTQYERFPYPHYSMWAKIDPVSACHSSFETGAALVHKELARHSGRRIGLFGCGTFEPYAQGALHPFSWIDAVDFSEASLRKAKFRCLVRRVKNVTFHQEDLVSYAKKNEGAFDFIHSYGVLHHLPDPQVGFDAIRIALKPTGFCRIMVYSKQRRRMGLIQEGARLLGLSAKSKNAPEKVKELLDCLPKDHPLRVASQLNKDLDFKSGVIDACLHECERPFDLKTLKEILKKSGLYIHAWDFSKNILDLIETARGQGLDEKMEYLEAFDQWPSSFTFWAAPFPQDSSGFIGFRTNPQLKGLIQKNMTSTVLRQKLQLNDSDLILLRQGLSRTLPNLSIKDSHFHSLLNARFLLGVGQ